MKETTSDRLKKIIYELYENDRDRFCFKTKNKLGTLSPTLNGYRTPGHDLLMGILDQHPDLSITWLLNGNGEMFLPDTKALKQKIDQLETMNEFLKRNLKS